MEELENIQEDVELQEENGNEKRQLGDAPKAIVNNNTTLRADLQDCYNQLRSGKIGLREAKEIANMAGKIVSSAKAQLDYNITVGKPDKEIDFFEDAKLSH